MTRRQQPRSKRHTYYPSAQRSFGRAANTTISATEHVAVGLFRWATTDHMGVGSAIELMPGMGIIDQCKYLLMTFIIGFISAALTGVWVALFIGYGIPALITGHF